MSRKKELPKAYEPQIYEDKVYDLWEKSGYFNPDNLKLPKTAKSYTIILPPPNITAQLHLGHASTIAIEDLLIRLHRMKGFRTLYLPGTDHAAIATQNVVEKKILKEEGKNRYDLGRELLLEKVWEFLRQTQATILNQARKMGGSFDWSRTAFTLDEKRQKAVREMFVRMYEAGAIYQGNRLVNWCPRCHSTLADDEVEYKKNKTTLFTFKYDANFPIAISTTRPETKLADTAVAVNPKDKRYKKFIGKNYQADFCGVKLNIQIIADNQIDMHFGTGALGVTPAHSQIDWDMAKKNNLPVIEVIDENGNIKTGFSEYSGQTVKTARVLIVQKIKENGLMIQEEDLDNNLSVCYRCQQTIEPLLSNQWFISVDKKLKALGNKSLKEKAIDVAKKKKILFFPERFSKRYLDWMENLHDWCISRQIWFGHRIPVWYCAECKKVTVSREEKLDYCPACHSKKIHQDEDTLDTWFSSGMWTFSTLGWPDNFKKGKKSGDLAKFHPTQVLETGYEIITLWVSRMIMMSLFAVGEVPFFHVYLHGMILDKNGKKMSKSVGNGIDPLDMSRLYGTDAVRLALLIGSTPGNDMRLDQNKIASFRNFVNKLWNISRFILTTSDVKFIDKKVRLQTLADKWIMEKLSSLIKNVNNDLKNYHFSLAGEKLRNFVWNDFADWYLEISKIEKNKDAILFLVLENILKLLHPFMPFVTEQIYQTVYAQEGKFLMIEKWPTLKTLPKVSLEKTKAFSQIQDLISEIRHLRNVYRIAPEKIMPAMAIANKKNDLKLLKESQAIIERLAKIEISQIKQKAKRPALSAVVISGNLKIFVDLKNLIDIKQETERISKEIDGAQKRLQGSLQRIDNKKFLSSAPKQIIKEMKASAKEQKNKLAQLKKYLKNLG